MKKTLIISTSPKKDGNSAAVLKNLHASLKARVLFLSDFEIKPCIDCGYCKTKIGDCSLDKQENFAAKALFDELLNADEIIFINPIHFYHLPSQFKALIDRSQRYWHKENGAVIRKIHTIFVAARPRGEKIPEGSLLTLKYFAPLIQAELASSLCLYGLDGKNDFRNSETALEKLKTYVNTQFLK